MSAHRTRLALCCECGRQRTTTTSGGTHCWDDYDPAERCTVQRKCATCRKQTTHAYLREDEHRDVAEQREYERIRASNAQANACEIIIEQLRAMGVRTYFDRDTHDDDGVPRVQVTRYLDDGVYVVTVSGAYGRKNRAVRLELLRSAWHWLWAEQDRQGWRSVFVAEDGRAPAVARCWSLRGRELPDLWSPFEDQA